MDRLKNPTRLMIVSDIDHTMVDHHDVEDLCLLRFNALWESNYRHDSLLVFSTRRSPTLYKELRKEKPMLTPYITIMSVGTKITCGNSMVETEIRPHKVSFYVQKDKVQAVTKALSESIAKNSKGQALAYFLKKFKIEGTLPVNTLVCGNSGNNTELFSILDVHGIMVVHFSSIFVVSNAQEELLHWYAENAKNNPKIIHTTERCAAGIIQAIGHFHLGPNISPREVADFSKCNLENVNSGHEMHPSGVFVHPLIIFSAPLLFFLGGKGRVGYFHILQTLTKKIKSHKYNNLLN
ncbi:hypothetical protein UlMin_011230 [Ulmus minor]